MKNPSKKRSLRLFSTYALLLAACALAISCSPSAKKFPVTTIGSVEELSLDRLGRLDPVIIRFKEPIRVPDAIAKAAALSPPVEGSWALRDDRTVEFTPKGPYKPSSTITLSVDTGLLSGKNSGKEGFSTVFRVYPAEFSVVSDGLYAENDEATLFSLSGTVTTDIPISERTASDMVRVMLGKKGSGKDIPVEWAEGDASLSRRFTVRHIERARSDRFLTLSWKGDPLGSRETGSQSWLVPARDTFSVLEIAASDPSCIEVRFSDRIDRAQDIRGLINVGNDSQVNVRYSVDSNVVKLYNTDGWAGGTGITVLEGIKSASGKTLMKQTSTLATIAWDIPSVRFATEGVILPPNNGIIVPVETKNLRGLIIEAYQIYGDNMLQFLQVNELDGKTELRRVGEPVWSKAIEFNWDDTMKNRYVPRGLDLTGLIKKYPGGMFQLRISFRKRHVLYQCTRSHDDFSSLPMPSDEITAASKENNNNDDDDDNDDSYWDYYDSEMDWETRQSYWDYRNDPCHPAFYTQSFNSSIVVHKNVLVSNLGIQTKRDADGSYYVAVSDIATTLPVPGASITLYSYAQKELAKATTDANGIAKVNSPSDAYFIAASKDAWMSWLRIDKGTSLSVSHFEIDGEKAAKGVKGFIYGERGVWRPGDDIHLVFVLQDIMKKLPAQFPVNFELQDPMGRIAQSEVYSNAVGGFYRIDTRTEEDDPTGLWIARVKVGGQTWTKQLKIETVVPNRLAINLKLMKSYLTDEDNRMTLTGSWLTGAKSPGLKADISSIFSPAETSFPGYSDYSFVNPERKVESERKTVWEGNLDDNSTAEINLDLSAGDSVPGKLNAQLITRLFEPSGAFSIEQVSFPYSPYNRYVGIKLPKGDAARGMLLTDTKHRMDIALLDGEGKPVIDAVPLSVAVYKLNWRWWWEKDALTDASFVSERSAVTITSGEVTVRGGRGSWEFEVKYPEWGRYLVVATDRAGGHSSAKIVYIDWPGWAGRAQDAGSGSASMLALIRDKNSYQTGETATISFGSSSGSRALVSVEKNGRIIRQDWVETAQGTTKYSLPLTPEMAPNVYIHVTMLQKHMQTANSLPIRLYGIVPVMVESPITRIQPIIETSDQYEPGKSASFTVSESSGRPMTYTVAVVDEGLLGLTRFTVPNPWNEFYKKEASQLSSWDIYNYVMSAFGGKLETLLSVGGSEDAFNANNKKAQRFKPVVEFFGPFELKAGAKATTGFTMPQYVGAVRVMVVAGKAGAYGTAEKSVPVRGDIMVLPTIPRTLGLNETVEIPVTVFNGKENAETVTVNLEASGALSARLSQNVRVEPASDKTISFRVTTQSLGKASIRVIGTKDGQPTGGTKAESVTEIDVLSRGSPVITARSFTVIPGQQYRDYVPSPGEKGTKSMSVEIGILPVIDLQTRLHYLITYPHGCIEQITSGGFPQLYIPELMETTDAERENIKKNVLSVIERYPGYQTPSGAFAYWPGNSEPSFWGSNYAGHFMVEAHKAGYEVPDSIYKAWLSFQQNAARSWQQDRNGADGENGPSVQAYRLYTLSLSGNPELASMNRLAAVQNLDENSKLLLAGAYGLAGHEKTANDLAASAALPSEEYRETGNTWGSNYRDAALALHIATVIGDRRKAAEMLPAVVKIFEENRWYSTQETAWYLMALAPHYRVTEKNEGATYSIDWDKGSITGEIAKNVAIENLEPFESPTQTLVVKNTGSKTLYGKAITRGMVSAGKETKIENGLGLTVQYLDESGRMVKGQNLALGDSFTVRVTVSNLSQENVSNIALIVPVPTCWEFGNDRVGAAIAETRTEGEEETDGSPALFDYQDIKDANVFTYFGLDPSSSKTFTFNATVAYNGNYYIPAVHAEAMYNADYQAVLPGQFVSRISGISVP
jgi:uncharacterized protein YfaS (alpha-2-macroglobulin family)